MKIAIISDIHGNLEAFREVLHDIDHEQIDDIFCLGDNVGYGPDPEAVVKLLRQREIPGILGNHELVFSEPEYLQRMNPSPRKSALLTKKLISPETMAYLSSLKPAQVFHGALCVHGCPPDSPTTYLFQISTARFIRLFKRMKESICFVGHTHDLEIIRFDGKNITRKTPGREIVHLKQKQQHLINVGSVGQPRDGNNNAKYVIWDTDSDTVEIRFVPYDIAVTVKKILKLGFPEYNANRLW